MRRTLQLLTGTALAAICGLALDAAGNPLFADDAVCTSGSSNVCMVSETCTEYGWQVNMLSGTLTKTCLAKTTKTFYWSSSTVGTSGTVKSYVPGA